MPAKPRQREELTEGSSCDDREQLETHIIAAGQALIRRNVSNLSTLLANVATLGRVLADMEKGRGGGREVDTYRALQAGAQLLCSTNQVRDDAALAWLYSVGWNPAALAADEADRSPTAEARQCLNHLLSHELPWWDPDDPERSATGRITVR